ncbi:DENN domain-containing protein 10 isoform X2 [Augochlora pura]
MAPLTDLLSCSIIEKDSNGDVLWTWSYPFISELQKAVVYRKCNLESECNSLQVFVFSRHKHDWFYIHSTEVFDSDKLPKFYLQKILIHGNMKFFRESLAKCIVKPENRRKFYNCIFLYSRKDLVLLKKMERLSLMTSIVTALHLEQLLKWTGLFPALMKHRKVSDNLFPWVDLVDDELAELKKHSHYVAGCRNSSISSRTDLFDLLVNIPAREITVASHAKESLTMTKTHKEIALFMVQLCENQTYTEAQIISEINDKTQDLLNQLTSLAVVQGPDGRKMVSAQTLKEKNLPPAVENFLINLAVVENLFLL